MANKRVVDTYSYQETQDAMRDPDVVGMREHHKNGDVELVLRPSNYPYKNNLNRTYQQVISDDARAKAMGDYDAINVDSEELIDFTPGFQDQYDADMAKVAANNARIQELEAIIAQKKQDEINFSKYRNNPLYKAAKFDYVVNGDRRGLDQFLADERAREQMLKNEEIAYAQMQNAKEIAEMNNERSASHVDNQAEDKLEMALLNVNQAKKAAASDPGNTTLQDLADKAELTYDLIAKRMGRKSYKELQVEKKSEESGEAGNVPATPTKSKADMSKDYMAEIKQAVAKDDYNKLTELLAELNDDAHKNETQYNDARTAATSAITEMNKKREAKRKAKNELSGILNGTHEYSDKDNVVARAAQLAKQLGIQATYGYDRKTGKVKEYLK